MFLARFASVEGVEPAVMGRSPLLCCTLVVGSMIILLDRVAGIQHVLIRESDSGDIRHAKINTSHTVTGRVWCFNRLFTDEMRCPFTAVPDSSYILHGINSREINVVSGVVFTQHEVAPSILQVFTFTESNTIMFGIVLESVMLERDR